MKRQFNKYVSIIMIVILFAIAGAVMSFASLEPSDPDDDNGGGTVIHYHSKHYSPSGPKTHMWSCSCGAGGTESCAGTTQGYDPNRYFNCRACGQFVDVPCGHGVLEWINTATQHKAKCAACGKVTVGLSDHHFVATNIGDGIYHEKKCTTNGCPEKQLVQHTFVWVFDSLNHRRQCSGCHEIVLEEKHNYVHNTSTHENECTSCSYENLSSQKCVSLGDATHQTICTGCNHVFNTEPHDFVKLKPLPNGEMYIYKCFGCQKTKQDY